MKYVSMAVLKFAKFLVLLLKLDQEQEEKLTFNVELVASTIIKGLYISAFALFFGTFKETAVLVMVALGFRIISGAKFQETNYHLITGDTLLFIVLGVMTRVNQPASIIPLMVFVGIIYSASTVIIMYFTPGGRYCPPKLEKRARLKWKIFALLFEAACLTATVMCFYYNLLIEYILPVAVGFGWEVFTNSPVGYRFMSGIDYVLSLRYQTDTIDYY